MLIIGFVVAQIIILGVVIALLRRLIFSDTNSAINRLTKLDNMNREKEKLLARKLEQAQKQIDEQKQVIQDEEQRIKAEARRAANQLHEDIIKKAKEEGDDIIRKAQAARDQIRMDAMIEAEGKMIEICSEILNKTLAAVVQVSMNEKLVEEFIAELDKADLSKINSDVNEIEIISSMPVSVADQEKIKKTLQTKLNRQVRLYTNEDPKLLGGILMKIGTMVVDGSLAERVNEAAAQMKQGLTWKYASK
ncbi:MAG: F0F1 ATP synthase subunit delta [Candidatus Omnitrophica bacterium]|jgi:F0F1-type ATP synthase membrane subunit b/b'|nr:F0F1 ATP synthase subunit delta [Candidatus Omnitrophota bacterium]